MKHVQLNLKGIIRGTFAFLLTLLFAVLFLCLGFGLGVFNDRIIIQKVNESNYYSEVHKELNKQALQLVTEAGLPASVMTDVITLERVYVNGKYYIEDTLAGHEAVIESDKIREDITLNIDRYLQEQKIERTVELDAGVESIISEIEQIYVQGIQLQLVNYITEYKASYLSLMKVIIPIVILLIGVLCYFLIRMNKYIHRGVRQISYATIASSSMAILTSCFLLLKGQYAKIDTAPEYYRRFLVSYLHWDMKVFLYLGLMGIVLSVILITFVGYLKSRIILK